MNDIFHEHHHHLLLGGARETLEISFGTEINDFRTFHPSSSEALETARTAIGRLNDWIHTSFSPLCRRPEFLKFCVRASLEQAWNDGVRTLETSFGVDFASFLHLLPSEMLAAIHETHLEAVPELDLRIDLGVSRSRPIESSLRNLDEFLNSDSFSLLRGIDLYDVEDAREPEAFREIFRTAESAGLKLKAHVGEFGSAQSVRHTVETLNLAEVQHGIHAVESPDVLRFLSERGTILNVSPVSNFYLHAMNYDVEPHPLRVLYDAGVRFTLSTDDFLLFHASIAQQLESLTTVFSPAELYEIRSWCRPSEL